MLDMQDLESIKSIIKVNAVFAGAGLKPNTYYIRGYRTGSNAYLKVSESELITAYLEEFGLTYDRSKNRHLETGNIRLENHKKDNNIIETEKGETSNEN